MKIGFHVSSQEAVNSGWIARFHSAIHLVLAVGIGGEVPRLWQVAAQDPGAQLIYRAWDYGDLGCSDDFKSYLTKFGTDPVPLIQRHEPCFEAFKTCRVAYQLFNETGMDDLWPKFVEFNTRFVQEMDRRGLSASVIGCGQGYPTGTRDEIRAKWEIARPLFEAINEATYPHFINLHEYVGYPHTNWIPYLCGRYKWLLEDLESMGLLTSKINIYAGEYGWADQAVLNPTLPPGPANGYRGYLTSGVTPAQLARDIVVAAKTIYADPHFVGLCVFCLGDSGNWVDFDLLREPQILEEIMKVEGTIVVEPSVVDTAVIPFKVAEGPLRIRQEPNAASAMLSTLAAGELVNTNGYVDNGYRWRRLADRPGYCAEYLDQDNRYLVQVEDSWKTNVLNQIDTIRVELDRLEAIIEQA